MASSMMKCHLPKRQSFVSGLANGDKNGICAPQSENVILQLIGLCMLPLCLSIVLQSLMWLHLTDVGNLLSLFCFVHQCSFIQLNPCVCCVLHESMQSKILVVAPAHCARGCVWNARCVYMGLSPTPPPIKHEGPG